MNEGLQHLAEMLSEHERRIQELEKQVRYQDEHREVCPNCENEYPHKHTDGHYSCEECGNEWNLQELNSKEE
jgi:ribosomal protein L37AE/L43A